MTHRDHRNELEVETQAERSSPGGFQEVLELLADHGFEGMAQAMQILLNEAMKLERSHARRTAVRAHAGAAGYANGFKPKSVETRVGRWSWPCRRPVAWSFIRRRWNVARAASGR